MSNANSVRVSAQKERLGSAIGTRADIFVSFVYPARVYLEYFCCGISGGNQSFSIIFHRKLVPKAIVLWAFDRPKKKNDCEVGCTPSESPAIFVVKTNRIVFRIERPCLKDDVVTSSFKHFI